MQLGTKDLTVVPSDGSIRSMRQPCFAASIQMDVSLQVLRHIVVPASLGQAVLMMAADLQCPCTMDTADLVEMTCKCMAVPMDCITPQKQVHWEQSVPFNAACLSSQAMLVLIMLMYFVCASIHRHGSHMHMQQLRAQFHLPSHATASIFAGEHEYLCRNLFCSSILELQQSIVCMCMARCSIYCKQIGGNACCILQDLKDFQWTGRTPT